jgi:hypothetical protein
MPYRTDGHTKIYAAIAATAQSTAPHADEALISETEDRAALKIDVKTPELN